MTMWNLTPLQDFNPREHLDVAFADGEVTEAEKDFLIELYGKYQAALGRPSDTLRASGQRADLYRLLRSAYALVQDDRRLGELRADLKLLADYCPYCGFAPISELDHHLPKSRFQLLSIFALNLVPCCGPCNRGKRRLPSIDPDEHQLHTYLESVAQFDFLRASASIDSETGALSVVYSIDQCEGMSDELFARLKCHLDEFKLHTKYAMQVNIHLAEQIVGFRTTFQVGPELLQRFLVQTAGARKERFGTNDWRTALFRGLAECEPFWSGGFERALGNRAMD